MNQEFITILHLYDIRVGILKVTDTAKSTYNEVSLPQLDSLLQEVIVDDDHGVKQKEVKDFIIYQLQHIIDYNGVEQNPPLIETRFFKDELGNEIKPGYLRVKKEINSNFTSVTGSTFTVPGIILSADTQILRTEGVIVESLLGLENGLDDYSQGLQQEAVRAKTLSNDLIVIEIDKNKEDCKDCSR